MRTKAGEAILVRLEGIHRGFIARCYRRGCPAVILCKAESRTTVAGFVERRPPVLGSLLCSDSGVSLVSYAGTREGYGPSLYAPPGLRSMYL